jgi:Lrp/AsnC family leucine-responsive transcriptional regulator
VISGYRAVVDPERVGLALQAFVRMSVAGHLGIDDEFVAFARGVPEILDVFRVTGAETYLLRVAVPAVGDLEGVLRPLRRFGDTVTGVVMAVPIADRPLTRSLVAG